MECIQKVFRPLDFFHILLHYSRILKLIQLFFPSPIYIQYHLMTKRKLLRKMYNRKLKYHIYISIQSLYPVLCWSTFGSNYSLESYWVWRYKLGTPVLDPLKFCQVGWGVLLRSWLGHSRTFRDSSRSHSCVTLAVCRGPEQVFNKDLSVLCSVHLSLNHD